MKADSPGPPGSGPVWISQRRLFVALALVFVGTWVWRTFLNEAPPAPIAYSQFFALLTDGKVQSVAMSGEAVEATLKSPETMAGRWAAKEAVSKVLGLGVRGIGWRDIEIERLPTGQPAVRLHGRAQVRAEQLGMGRIAVTISHEADYAVAMAFGLRTTGGRYLFPPDIEDRLDDRERRILARIERLRDLAETNGAAALASDAPDPVGATRIAIGLWFGFSRGQAWRRSVSAARSRGWVTRPS